MAIKKAEQKDGWTAERTLRQLGRIIETEATETYTTTLVKQYKSTNANKDCIGSKNIIAECLVKCATMAPNLHEQTTTILLDNITTSSGGDSRSAIKTTRKGEEIGEISVITTDSSRHVTPRSIYVSSVMSTIITCGNANYMRVPRTYSISRDVLPLPLHWASSSAVHQLDQSTQSPGFSKAQLNESLDITSQTSRL
ncbi:unnamed protein product [Caenorhabditis bovis]|uniref:Uncharacterized protein n=1 Tax=Caenorhabditis bovis TaxID=2654633 RepID=A0A8S1EA57_9PELO|nr:unnamed protein product [Caenorhabditis bovis]